MACCCVPIYGKLQQIQDLFWGGKGLNNNWWMRIFIDPWSSRNRLLDVQSQACFMRFIGYSQKEKILPNTWEGSITISYHTNQIRLSRKLDRNLWKVGIVKQRWSLKIYLVYMAPVKNEMSLQVDLISPGLSFLKSYFRFILELNVNCCSRMHVFKSPEGLCSMLSLGLWRKWQEHNNESEEIRIQVSILLLCI